MNKQEEIVILNAIRNSERMFHPLRCMLQSDNLGPQIRNFYNI
jgi:hypothetical protein